MYHLPVKKACYWKFQIQLLNPIFLSIAYFLEKYIHRKSPLNSIHCVSVHKLLLRWKKNQGTELLAYPVLVNDIHNGHQLASMRSEGNEGNSANLDKAFEHLGTVRIDKN